MPDLLERLHDSEDNFVERKPDGVNGQDIRKAIVGFANSVPESRTAVLFIGVRDDGTVQGVSNSDSLQKTVRRICEQQCYPPIQFSTEVIRIEEKQALAIVVPFSQSRPHFAGAAFVRRGSETVEASEEQYEKLILSKIDKCREILKWHGEKVTVIARGKELGSTKRLSDPKHRTSRECVILECTAHHLRLQDSRTEEKFAEPMENVTISHDENEDRLLVLVEEVR